MSDATLQHTQLQGVQDYIGALDTLCSLPQHTLSIFEKDFDGIGFNSEARYDSLRHFLLSSPHNRLQLLAHSTRTLSQYCPRMMMLLRQFGHSMAIHETPIHLQSISEPFAVADESHYVRRFHFDDMRGIFARNDPEGARLLKSRFAEMWAASRPSSLTTSLNL